MSDTLEFLARREGEDWLLLAPAAGELTGVAERGRALCEGLHAGVLLVLGRRFALQVPTGVAGWNVSERPERVHAPVGYEDVIYRLTPLQGAPSAVKSRDEASAGASSQLVFRSPQTGRFYHRPAPSEAAFLTPGDVLESGRPVGLIEVMKTFTHVHYRARGGLPARARFLRYIATHASDVREGDALCELAES